MSCRKSQIDFENEVKAVLPNIEILGDYKNNKTRIAVKCLVCGRRWEPIAQSLLGGHGCQTCAGNRKMTQNEFANRVIKNNKDIDVIGLYINSASSVKVKCKKCGYEWDPKANSILNGRGCPQCKGIKKKTSGEFKEELKQINSNLTLLSEYINNRTHVNVRCDTCGYEWDTSPKSLLRGSGCPKCVRNKISENRAKNAEAFQKELHIINPNVVVEGNYKNNRTHIDVMCKNCGYRWRAMPSILLKSKGCPICTGNKAVWKGKNDLETTNPELAKEWSFEKNAPLKPSEVRAGSVKKVWWKGKCGHEWIASVCSRNKGSGCPICSNNIRKTTKRFADEMNLFNPYIEIIGEYQTAMKPIKVRCRICGYEWSNRPNTLLRGVGCTNCVKRQTSFMEQFLLISFRKALSDELVLSRCFDAIGMELDIYIPNINLAIEPGSWLYHKDKMKGTDAEKRRRCSDKNIRLLTIYDTYPKNSEPPFDKDCYVFDGFLNEYGFERIINLTQEIMSEYRIKFSDLDWKDIANEAYLACHYNAHDNFCKELSVKFPNIEVLEQYKGSGIPILVKDKTCNHQPWKARPYTLLKGIGCPECALIASAKSRTKTHKQFVEEIEAINSDIEIITKYEKAHKRITVQCKQCGYTWNPYPYSLLDGKGCPHCSALQGAKKRNNRLSTKTTEQFVAELRNITSQIEVVGEYINSKTVVSVKCLQCGNNWNAVPASLLNGHGCPICSRNRRCEK